MSTTESASDRPARIEECPVARGHHMSPSGRSGGLSRMKGFQSAFALQAKLGALGIALSPIIEVDVGDK